MRRRLILPALIALALVGAVLIWTADDGGGVALEEFTTAEGLATQIPEGWVVSEQFPFEFAPSTAEKIFDQWTVARACPPDGCAERSLDEWLTLARELPTFTNAEAAEGEDTFFVKTESFEDAYVLRAKTESAADLVFVAAFTDGAEDYVACAVRIGTGSDPQLADAIVDVCRSTRVAEGA